ncbi:MAG: hypothetical protein IJH63_16430 [Methanobrevibacter sp.]|nr:hypothetical protein [Methanobrevibacter sp.]
MRNIIIVQCTSTGKNYVQDIINRKCNPIVLELRLKMIQKKRWKICKK